MMIRKITRLLSAFRRENRGTVAVIFGLSLAPAMILAGAAADYSRGLKVATQAQTALDAAVLGAMEQPAGTRAAAARRLFDANFQTADASVTAETFTESSSAVSASVAVSIPTRLVSAIVPAMTLSRSSSAAQSSTTVSGGSDNSCILTLGEQLTVSSDVMTFNGSPAVALSGCSLRSNKSMDCNGHSTGAQTYAVGSIVGCSYPHSGQATTPDSYAAISSNIQTYCGANAGGYSWVANETPPAAIANTVIPVSRVGYNEIHVCGSLTLSGAAGATLTGATPGADTVVIIENGALNIASAASITANRVTFVLAGGSGQTPIVNWPSGNGANASSMSISASTSAANPWQGMAIYSNPTLNYNMSWGSGVTFSLDGVLYFPNAGFTVYGQLTSGPTGCSKVVVGEFTLDGSVNLRQSAGACASLQVSQYVYPSTVTSTAYLSR